MNTDEQLEELLDSLSTSSKFCTTGFLEPVLPGLEIDSIGQVGLPVSPEQAESLQEIGNLAPFGKGEMTVYDNQVRNVIELDPAQITFRNPAWDRFIGIIVTQVKTAFAIEETVAWEFYKMLVYDQNSFFLPHRDSEKENGMVATLVVSLPSKKTGGSISVSHDGFKEEINFDDPRGAFQVQYVAFYTDCQHEVKPLKSGHRICLVYNLSIKGKRSSAPLLRAKAAAASALLRNKFDASPLKKIVVPLTHGYSQAGLDLHLLKGQDRSILKLLDMAARALDFRCYLALMTHYQSGTVEENNSTLGYRYEDDEDDVEMEEVFEDLLYLNHFIDMDGARHNFGRMPFNEEEMPAPLDDDFLAKEQDVEGPTGNAGSTMERWYRGAAVVIWPQEHHYDMLLSEGHWRAIPHLEGMINGNITEAREEGLRLARKIIDKWKRPSPYSPQSIPHLGKEMIELLTKLNDGALADRFVRVVLTIDYTGNEGVVLAALANQVGWDTLTPALKNFISGLEPLHDNLSAVMNILLDLCNCANKPERRKAAYFWCEAAVEILKYWQASNVKINRVVLMHICESLVHLEAGPLLDSTIELAIHHPDHFHLQDTLIPTLSYLAKAKKVPKGALKKLHHHCLRSLKALIAAPIQEPKDWEQSVTLNCSCQDCKTLQNFLHSPTMQVLRLGVRKDRRRHLHAQIDNKRLDLTHKTERSTNPHTLVCIKTRASYERKQRSFEEDSRLHQELLGMRRM